MNRYLKVLACIAIVISFAACKRLPPTTRSSIRKDSTQFVKNHDTLDVIGKAAIIFMPTDSELTHWFSTDTSTDSEETYTSLDDDSWYAGICSQWLDSMHIPNQTSNLQYVRLNFPERSVFLDRDKLLDTSEMTSSGIMLLSDGKSHWIADESAFLDPTGDSTLHNFFNIK